MNARSRVLMIEDDEAIRRLVQRVLVAGFDVQAADVKAGLASYRQQRTTW